MNQLRIPASVSTAAILLFVYGGMMVFCNTCGIAMASVGDDPGMRDAMEKEVPGSGAVEVAAMVIGIALSLSMIVVGIGLYRLSPAARYAAFGVAALEIVITLVHSGYVAILVVPVQERLLAAEAQNMPPMGFDFAGVMSTSMWVGLAMSVGACLAFCLPVIWFLSTPAARAAFERGYLEPLPSERRPRYDGYDEDEDDHDPPPPRGPETGFTDRG